MACGPTLSIFVEKAACPPLNGAVPKVADPSLNVTLPVGVAPADATTFAVSVMLNPYVEGFRDEVIVAVVVAVD